MLSLRRWLRVWNRDRVRQLHEARRRRVPGRVLRLEALEDRVLPSAAGPYIISYTPSQVRNSTFDHIDVTFNEAIDATTFTKDDVTIQGPSAPVAVTEVDQLTDSSFRLLFPALTTRGTYQASIGPNIADLAGHLMDQNQNGVPGETPGDVFTTSLVYINANVILTSPTTITEGNTTYDGQDLLIDGTTVTIDGPHQFNSVQIIDGGVLTHDANTATQTHSLNLTVAEQVIVDATSRIDVSGKGYLPGRTSGNTSQGGATGGGTGNSGGSYGGYGGLGFTYGGVTNAVYGDYADPEDWGAGGADGQGGGQVRIRAGTLSLDGRLLADGADSHHGPGAGGGVYVAVTTLRGAGSIRAGGGAATVDYGGAGGGGRVAVYYATLDGFNLASVSAPGSNAAGAGTVYLRASGAAYGTLVLDGQGSTGWTPLGLAGQSAVTIPDAVVIQGRGTNVGPEHSGLTLTFSNALTVQNSGHLFSADEIHLGPSAALLVRSAALLEVPGQLTSEVAVTVDGGTFSGSRLEAPAVSVVNQGLLTSLTSTSSQMYRLELVVTGTLSVDTTSRIDVSRKGYLPGRTSGNTSQGGATGGGTGNSGGSYGGYGGLGFTYGGVTNAVYGDYADPEDWGAGGADGQGGGQVRIRAGTLSLDGRLLADGADSNHGPGAGGGVYVAATTLRGAGSIRAGGGAATADDGGAGGGGRVAVYYGTLDGFNLAGVTAPGHDAAGAGTVHLIKGHPYTHVRWPLPMGVNGGYIPQIIGDHVLLQFNHPIDVTSFDPAEFVVDGQMGRATATGITQVGDRLYQIDLARALTEDGPYHFSLPTTLQDSAGYLLDQNANGIPGEPDDSYSWTYIIDTVPPRVTQHSPAGDIAGTVDHVDVWFSEAIDTTTLTAAQVAITRPDGQSLAVNSIQPVGLDQYRISFASQTLVGQYHVRIGSGVSDLAGNSLVQTGADAGFNVVSVDLGLNNLTLSDSQLVAGEPITVSWNGMNRTGAPLLGNWTDAVYLSADDKWDIGDTLLATVPHTGGLAQNQVYSGSATVVIPGMLPGNYHILVRSDVYNQEKEGTGEANNLLASETIPLTIHELATSGAPLHGTLVPTDRADYYAIHVVGGYSVSLALTGLAATGVNELYASFEAIPTRLSYDYRAVKGEDQTNRQDQTLAFTAPPGGGTFYVLVYGDQIDGSSAYGISGTTGPFVVTSITPDRGTNRAASRNPIGPSAGRVIPSAITVTGAGFTPATTVQFVGSDGSVRAPSAVHFISQSTLTFDLDLTTWPAGVYDVHVAQGTASYTRPAAFHVVAGGVPHLETNLIVPSSVGFNIPVRQTIWVEYTNTGDAAMPAPLLKLHGDNGALLTADINLAIPFNRFYNQQPPAGVTDTVQLLATGSGAEPGTLQPGESGRIPVYYIGLAANVHYPSVTFSLSNLTADDVSWQYTTSSTVVHILPDGTREIITTTSTSGEDWHVNWTGLGAAVRPASVSTDAWDAVVTNLAAQIGPDWGNYDEALAKDANFLHAVGQDTKDVGQLWNYEVAQASAALNPVQYLDGAVDASVPAPGLPLTFSRVYGEPITSRYKLGSLGRGWSDNWDVSAETESNGDVVLHGPGDVDRFFTLDRLSYRAAPGDFGQLTSSGGAYRLTETDQTVWQFRTDGLLDSVADSNGDRITLGYTGGLLTSLTHSGGQQLLIAYNAAGRIASVTDPATGRVTTYEYDASGEHLIRVTEPGNRVTTYSYDTGTNLPTTHGLLSVAYPDGTHDFFAYDSHGRLQQMNADGGAGQITFAYDTAGGVTVTDATGRQTFLAYGLGGQLAQVRDADGRVVNLGQDAHFQLTQLIGPAGEKYAYGYDTHGNLTGVRDPLRQATAFTYDATFNQLTSVTDARGNGMTYGYDGRGNLISITYADGTRETFTYDAAGNVLTSTNRRGQTVAYTYNAAGEVTSKDYLTTPGTDFVYTYDVAGNLTSAKDASGTTVMTYDPATNLLTSITYPGGHSFTFAYDTAGRRTKRTDEAGNVENYVYGAAGRLDHMTDRTGAPIVQYAYDAAGRLSKKTLGNGVYTTYDYDAAGNVLHLVNFKADGSVLSRFDYTYDASGRLTAMQTLTDSFLYDYDPLGELTGVTRSPLSTNEALGTRYVYDAAGNRVSVTDVGGTTAYTTNALNEYTQAGGATFAYDADGNMTSKTEGGVTTHYTYDIENRLVGVSTPTDTWTYSYDAFGNRVAATHNGVATKYVIDPTGLGNVAAEYDGNGHLVARYDDGYGLLDRIDATGSAGYYTFSAIGNTSELTSATGGVLNQYAYDPFGLSLGKKETVANPFEYVGEYGVMDEGNGLEFMRVRAYDANTGRFVQHDPLGIVGGLNLYSYAANQPSSVIDPTGRFPNIGKIAGSVSKDIGIGGMTGGVRGAIVAGAVSILLLPIEEYAIPALILGTLLGEALDPSGELDPNETIPLPDPGPFLVPAPPLEPIPAPNYRPDPEQFNVHNSGPTPHIPPAPTPIPPDGSTKRSSSKTVRSFDPNDKFAPAGYSDAAYVTSDSTMAYQVRFENKADATGPARQIVVTDTLDPNLDLNTFQLSEIAFANQTITIPPGLDHYETTVPMNANGTNILVDVQAALDRAAHQLTLTLRAIDPATGWIPEDPLTGLLYPDDDTGRGQGSISYSAAPLAGLPSGTVINNRASIVFDFNDPIATPQVHNTLDAAAPSSHVLPLSAVQTGTTFTVQWAGQDEAGGSGIAGYNVYVSADGGPYVLLAGNTTDTSTTVVGQAGHTYAFYSVATDNVGHVEATPTAPQATTLLAGPPTSSVAPLPAVTPTTDFTLTWSGTPGPGASSIASYDIFVSTDGGPFTPFLTGTTQTSATFTGANGHTYGFYSVATDDLGDRQPTPTAGQATTLIQVPTSSSQLVDPGFEAPGVGAGISAYVYDPSGSAWTFSGTAGLTGNASDFTGFNPAAPQGSQVAFVQQTGSISQGVVLDAGTYALSFSAAQRGNMPGNRQAIQVLVDGTPVGTFTPPGSDYATYSTASFTVASGAHTITFAGLNPNGRDNTAFLDQVALAVSAPQFADPGFEEPAQGIGVSAYAYAPVGSSWTFRGTAGLAGNLSGFTSGNPTAPEGSQVAFVQQQGTVSQTVGFTAGTYAISFSAAQRGNIRGNSQTVQVLLDGTAIGMFTPPSNIYATYSTASFTVAAGQHTITFMGMNPDGGDNTAFLDQVAIAASTPQFADPGFGGPSLGTGAGAYRYDPSGSSWTFGGTAGLAGNGSVFTAGNPNAPDGTQVAFLQQRGSISQMVGFAAGAYTISFSAAQRANWQFSRQTIKVFVDGVAVGTFTPSGTNYATYTTDSFTVTAGAHTIAFVGLDPDGGDNTALIDQIAINPAP